MTLYLIRHGLTRANEEHLYCGSTDLPLSDRGRAQLRELKYDIKNVRFISSGMKRADETMEILFGSVPYDVEADFREVDFGDFEMRSYEELKDTEAYREWLSGDNEANVPPGGESGAEMKQRVLGALTRFTEDTLIVSHGGVIAAIMEQMFPDEAKSRYEWQPENGRGYKITADSYERIP